MCSFILASVLHPIDKKNWKSTIHILGDAKRDLSDLSKMMSGVWFLLGLHIIPTCLVFYKFGTSITGAPHQPPASIGMAPLTGRNVDKDGVDDPWPASGVASRKIFGT